MKSVILAAIALAGFTAAAPPSYHQHPRNYAAVNARDAAYSAETVIPYYKTVKEYVPRAAMPAPIIDNTVIPKLDSIIPKRESKPMPKYKQYKAPPKYGSRKRQELPAAVPAVPEVPSVPEVPELPVKRQEIPDVSDVTGAESDLPTSTLPQIGSVA